MANATVLDPSSPGGKQQQQQADALGISLQQYQALVAQYPPQYQANSQGGSYGMSAGGSYGQNPQLTDVLNGLAAQKQLGLGQQQQQGPASTSASGGPFTDATNLAGRMGAAAIGGKQIINPTPGMIPQGSKGGVAEVGSPMVSSDVPTMPGGTWSGVAGPTTTQGQAAAYNLYNQYAGNAATSNPADIAKFYQGMTGQTIAQANAGAPPASGGTPTPTKPANAPGGAAATPWASAPPAAPGTSAQPGATDWGAVAAHSSALEDAGKGIYAHLTGNDPANATHADIASFHDVLQQHIGAVASQMSGAQSGGTPFGAAPPGAANYTAGVQPGIAATGATPGGAVGVAPPTSPIKMAEGGFVPDQDQITGMNANPLMSPYSSGPSSLSGGINGMTDNPLMTPYNGPGAPVSSSGDPSMIGQQPPTPPWMQDGGQQPPWMQGGGQPWQGDQGGGVSGATSGLGSMMRPMGGGQPPPWMSGGQPPPWMRGGPGGGVGSALGGMYSGKPLMTPYNGPGSPGAGMGPPPPAPSGTGQFGAMASTDAAAEDAAGGTHMAMPEGYVPPKQMNRGGRVPGRGNQDTVPALLTPGEYVIPKQQAAQLFGGRPPIRMASGGWVDDDDRVDPQIPTPPPKHPPSEIPRGMGASATPAQQGAPSPGAPQQQSSSGSGSDSDSGSDKASPTNHGYWSNMVQQAQTAKNAQVGSGGPGSIDSLGTLGDESVITGQTPGQGPANSVAAGADVASGLISGLQEAWDKYAKSIKNWQTIAPAFSQGGAPSYQTTQLQQDQDA